MAPIAPRIAQSRRAAGLTQRQLAEQLGVTAGAVGQWEAGVRTPSAKNVARLAKLLGTPADVLLGAGPLRAADELALLKEARELGVDLQQVVANARQRRWLEENRQAIADGNAYLERTGLWSDGKRLF